MLERNKLIHRRWLTEVLPQARLELIEEIFTPNARHLDPTTPGLPSGYDGAKALIQLYRGAFPDLQMSVLDQLGEGEKVVTSFRAQGTHQGPLGTVAPTGRRVEVVGIEVARFADGRIEEIWGLYDALGLMKQLGVVPQS